MKTEDANLILAVCLIIGGTTRIFLAAVEPPTNENVVGHILSGTGLLLGGIGRLTIIRRRKFAYWSIDIFGLVCLVTGIYLNW